MNPQTDTHSAHSQPPDEDNRPYQDPTEWATVTACSSDQLDIQEETHIAHQCPIYRHTNSGTQMPTTGFQKLLTAYTTAPQNNRSLGSVTDKADTIHKLLTHTHCSLLELDPWLVSKHTGTEKFDRWEPFCLGHIESSVAGRQLKVTNLTPVSELNYRLNYQTPAEPSTHFLPQNTDISQSTTNNYVTLTRHHLDASFNGHPNQPAPHSGASIDSKAIRAVHVLPQSSTGHLIVGSQADGTLYCGRGQMNDTKVDIQIGLGWRTNEHNEEKVAVYNDYTSKSALTQLPWRHTHARYLGQKGRWEIDLSSIELTLKTLLEHPTVEYVSIHNTTESIYQEAYDGALDTKINGYHR